MRSVCEKHIHVYGLVSTRDLILLICHDITFVRKTWYTESTCHPLNILERDMERIHVAIFKPEL